MRQGGPPRAVLSPGTAAAGATKGREKRVRSEWRALETARGERSGALDHGDVMTEP